MPTFLQRIKLAWAMFTKPRPALMPVATPEDFDYPEVDEGLMQFLEGMYKGHGADAFIMGNWVVVDNGRLFARAAHFDHRQHPKNLVLQCDFVTVLHSGQHIIESFAGIGTDLRSSLTDACANFQNSCFHVLFTALLGHACDHVSREEWRVNGTPRKVITGPLRMRMRGQVPLGQWEPSHAALQTQVQAFAVPPGLHWMSYFYACLPGRAPTIEVRLDNERCIELQTQAAQLPWPTSEEFYSARLFFTIQDA